MSRRPRAHAWRWARAIGVTLALAMPAAAQTSGPPGPATHVGDEDRLPPRHQIMGAFSCRGEAELRLGHDRVLGVGNPDLLSVPRLGAIAALELGRTLRLEGGAAYDRATDDMVVERARLEWQAWRASAIHVGILPLPLLQSNLRTDTPGAAFGDRSLVADHLVGVPSSQLGLGLRGLRGPDANPAMVYELDVVAGYDDGVIGDAPDGTRVPRGRNNFADHDGLPALAARIEMRSPSDAWLAFGGYGGQYNQTRFGGATVDRARYAWIATADGAAQRGGIRVKGEAAFVAVDVPPGLVTIFARQQVGGALELSRILRQPLIGAWGRSALEAAVRADAVDFDRAIAGDSRERIAVALNLRQQPQAVFRFDFYHEWRRDRFAILTPAAGVAFGVGTYF